MRKRQIMFVPLFFALLFSLVFAIANTSKVRGQMTIPTRTPVPGSATDSPPNPTDDGGDNGGDNGGGGNNGGGGDNGGGDDGGNQPSPQETPQPEDTPVPPPVAVPATNTPAPITGQSPTPTSTNIAIEPTPTLADDSQPTVEAAPTISAEQLDMIAPGTTPLAFPVLATAYPTAVPCGEPPTLTTLTTANTYDGPGSDYPVSVTLGAKEVRPIVGRAATATWWLIQLDGKFSQAWISDKAGTVHGYTGNLPIIEAPSINGALPTPGEEWDPTPAPICTQTPTPTSDGSVISGSIAIGSGASAEKVNTNINVAAAEEQRNQIAEEASPVDLEIPSTTPTPNLLPIAGLVLIIAAIFVALFLRRSPGGSDTSS